MDLRLRSGARWRAGLLAAYALAAVTATYVLAATADRSAHSPPSVALIALTAPPTAVACLMLIHLPGHAVTRVLTVLAVAGPTASWSDRLLDHVSGVAAALVERLLNVAWALSVPVLALLILLFPDGRPPGPRWRPVLRLQVAALATIVGCALVGTRAAQVVAAAAAVVLVATAAAAVVSLVLRMRRADPRERAGIRAFAVLAVGLVGWYVAASAMFGAGGIPAVGDVILPVLVVGLPTAIAYGVFRHRLYGVDIVIRRTVVWLALSSGLLAAYLAVAALVAATAGDGRVAAVAAAAVVVLILAPAGRLAQAGVDRLLYGRRGDPALVLAMAGRTLAAAGAPHDVPQRLASLVTSTLRLPWAGVELDREGGWDLVATAGRRDEAAPAPETIRVTAAGEEPARLVVQPRRGESALTATDRRLLADLAAQVGPALLSVRLVDELERSRDRLAAARRDERDRIRRDLHDTLSPALNGVRLAVSAARRLLHTDPARADSLLRSVGVTAEHTVGSVRQMLADLRSGPPAADDLAAAITAGVAQVAQAAGLTVDVRCPARLPPATAEAVYRIAVEAVTNAARHSGAGTCTVLVTATDEVTLEVLDDGCGMREPVGAGVGIESMKARAAHAGGRCEVTGAAGDGTRVYAVLPLVTAQPPATTAQPPTSQPPATTALTLETTP